MATNIVTGKKYHILTDLTNKVWSIISFWTKASDVEFNDGKTAEAKLGVINGITSDINCEDETIAASVPMVNEQISNCFQSVSDGKALLASAITGKGVKTDASASFATMANNIKKITVGAKTKSGTFEYSLINWQKKDYTVSFTGTPFVSAPVVQATALNSRGNNDDVTIKSVTAAGFVIEVHHNSDNVVTGTVTWNAVV